MAAVLDSPLSPKQQYFPEVIAGMNFNALAYEFYFAAKKFGVAEVLRRAPRLGGNIKRIVHSVLPQNPWVQVQSGLSQGMWMALSLPDEVRLWRGEHELVVQRAILAAVHAGHVFYDIGAHIGSIALGAAKLVRPSGLVVAFEADPENVAILRKNAARNDLVASLQIVHAAVWSSSSITIPFRRSGARRSHGGVETARQRPVLGSGGLVNVPAVTLDDFIANGGAAPQFIKVDVEGGEYEVLRGGTRLFEKHRPVLLAEVHHRQAAQRIGAWLREREYDSRWITPPEQFPCRLFAWPDGFDGADWMSRSAIKT